VANLNKKIETILTQRLEELLEQWVDEFVNFDKKGGNLIKEPLVLDVKLINRTIVLEPSLSEAKSYWYGELHKQVEIICGLERLDIKIEENQDNYRNLLL
jgi:hypothetical protein